MSRKYGYIASIGADTSGVVKALQEVETATKNMSTRLKTINEGLKFDSKSPELLLQKYETISEQVENTKKKLEALKSVEQQAEVAYQRGDMRPERYAAYQQAIVRTEESLKVYNIQLANAKAQLDKAQEAMNNTAYATKGLGTVLDELNDNDKEFNATLKEVNAALSSGAGTEMLQTKYNTLSQAIENTKQKLNALKSAEQAMSEGVSNGSVPINEQKKYQNEINRTEIKLKQYESQLAATQQKLSDTAEATDKANDETKQFEVTLKEAGKSALSFGDVFKANVFSDFVVNGIRRAKDEIVDFAKSSIETASNLAEVQNVVDVTFGNNAQSINTWSREAATAFGMSELAAKQYAGTMGAMLKSSGIAEGAVTDLSKSIVQLAGDMASFYNLDISASFDKIRAGIAGETEPLRQLGINMSVANLEAYALSQGIETAWKNMSQSEQVILRYNYLMAQTADAQGDFARTSDSLANQQRIAKLNMEQIQAALGEKLIPLVGELTGELNDNMPSIGKNIEQVGDKVVELTRFILDNKEAVIGAVTAFATYKATIAGANVVSSGITAFRSLTTAIKGATTAQEIFNIVVKENPYVLIASVAALTAGLIAFASTADTAANKLRDINKEIETLNKNTEDSIAKTEGDIAVLKAKAEEYENLRKEQNLTAGQEQRLADLAKELQQYMPEGTKLIDEQTGAYNGLTDSIDKATEAMRLNAKLSAYKEEYEGLTKQLLEAEKVKESLSGKSSMTIADMWAWNNAVDTIKSTEEELSALENKIADVYEESAKSADKAYTGMGGTSTMADYYRQEGTSVAKELEDYEKELENGLKSIEEQYNKHQIVNGNGEQDEAEYYKRRREYLQEHCDKTSEIWWKHWDDVSNKEKQMREKQKSENEKAAKEAEKQKEQVLKSGIGDIETEYKRTVVPEDKELEAEALYLKKRRKYLEEHCDKSSDVWNDYWTDLIESEKKFNEKLKKADEEKTKDALEVWSKSYNEIFETQKKAHDELTKEKENAYNELSGIDLASTVTGADGKDKTILTDLNEATKKLTEYQNSLKRLKNTGISDDLLNEILNVDYDSGERQRMINTILGLSESKRKLYYSDYEKYNTKAKEVAQSQIQDAADELNKDTSEAVKGAFEDIEKVAYQSGVDTAKSYIQGIKDNLGDMLTSMSGTAELEAIQALLNNDGANSSLSANKTESRVVYDNSPINIYLDGKPIVETTIKELKNYSATTGGNILNL